MPRVALHFDTPPNEINTELATFTRYEERGGHPYVLTHVASKLGIPDRWLMIAFREWGEEIICRSSGKNPAIKAAKSDLLGATTAKPPRSRARKF